MNAKPDVFRKTYSIFTLFVLTSAVLFWQFSAEAEISESEDKPDKLSNYDIRTDQSAEVKQALASFVAESGKPAAAIETERKRKISAEIALRSKIPNLRIEQSEDLRIPEIIASEAGGQTGFLTSPSNENRVSILRAFLKQNSELIGLEDLQIDALEKAADYTNPNGVLSFVEFDQKIGGVPIFRGELKAGFTKRGEIIRIVNNLAPDLTAESLSTDFGNAESAVSNAAKFIDSGAGGADTKRIEAASNDLKITFEQGQFADQTTAEKIYFPVESGVARTAWRVLLWTKTDAFYVIVDARDGTLLWRKNITDRQTQTATYNVYGNLTSLMKTADSPAPGTPGCLMPVPCPQPPIIPRVNFTLIGNEPPYNFNDNGWINDGENRTIGNAAEAGIDRISPNGIDDNGWAFGNPSRNFVYTYNPAPGDPPPGEEPVPTTQTYPPSQFQQGSITHAFYAINRWHDEMYRLGFTEPARNFQINNFGRGGTGNDSISVEVQDGSGSNSANFSTAADGNRGRLQLFVWTGPTPDRDGALDSQVIVHEASHGVSSRLHGNAAGLTTNMAGGMGEGWGDFYALALLSEPTDGVFGTYTIGCYVTYQILPGFESNCYYGIRRFPTARIAALGPNGLPHNPLTFKYINSNCNTLIGTTASNPNSAFPRGPIGVSQCDQVHNLGEVWSAALWEMRGQLIDLHGAADGNRRALQYVTDGMKLAPLNPTFLQERDAIIAAATVSDPNDAIPVRRGFALRGMGYSASIQNPGNGNNTTVITEAFDVTPNLVQSPQFTFSDPAPGGNNNGYAEPGENIILSIPLTNPTGSGMTATNTTLQVVGGGTTNYGSIPIGQTVTSNVSYTVPIVQCGNNLPLTFNVNSSLGMATFTRSIPVGVPYILLAENFDGATAPALPANWTSQQSGAGVDWTTSVTSSDTAPNSVFTTNPSTVSEAVLTSPVIVVNPGFSGLATLEFKNNYNLESTFDGGVLEISIGNGAFTDIISAGGSFISGGYSNTISTAFGSPLAGRMAWSGISDGYVTTRVALPQASYFQNTRFRWRMGSDVSVGAVGWRVDSVKIYSYFCGGDPAPRTIADFDGDGKTDLSVFRPNEGNWYLNRSTSGFTVVNWGLAADQITPGDFDGDSKADLAVFRPNADGNLPDFYILNSSTLTYSGYSWGLPGDLPVIEDYDGDGKSDVAVYRPSNHTYYVLRSNNGTVLTFSGITSGTPAAGDYDGDGKADFITYNGDGWFIARSSINYATVDFVYWGTAGDKPVMADYDGDTKDDLAVFRPSDRTWYIRRSSGGNSFVQFGLANDIPVPGDYDGDGRMDIAVYRDGTWYLNRSTAGILIAQFGLGGDMPIPNRYLP